MIADISKARQFAYKAHGNQCYGDGLPYVVHLQAVDSVLLSFGLNDCNLRMAAWTHDVLEDTNETYEHLLEEFGDFVANIVACVTEPKGGNRRWRHEQTYPKIAENAGAILVKLADRIANVEFGGKLVDMYRKEQEEFEAAIRRDFSVTETKMWDRLNGLLGM